MGRKHQRPDINKAQAGDKRKRNDAPATKQQQGAAGGRADSPPSPIKFEHSKKKQQANSSSDDEDSFDDVSSNEEFAGMTNQDPQGADDSGELSEVSSFGDEEDLVDSEDSSDGVMEEMDEADLEGGDLAGSSGDDEEETDSDESGDFMFPDEEGQEESEDDSDMVDDEYDTAEVNFDVNGMNPEDVERAFHMFDSWIPDEMNFVDRDLFGEALVDSPHTSLVEMGEEGAAKTNDEDNNVVGIVSIIDVARGKKTNKGLDSLAQLFNKPFHVVADGVGIKSILVTSAKGKHEVSRGVVLVNERVKNLPVELTSKLLSHTFDTFNNDLKMLHLKLKGKETLTEEELEVAAQEDYMLVVMAKIQRAQETLDEDGKKSKKDGDKLAQKSKKKEEGFNMANYVFWREEDEFLWNHRDTRIAATAFKCRAQYDRQPEAEVPLSLVFAVTKDDVTKALAELEKQCTLQAL